MPTRLHRANVLTDVFGGGDQIARALTRFEKEGRGVLIYLRDGTSGVPVQTLKGQANSDDARQQQWREIGLGAQILKDLGVSSIVNLTSSARSYVGLAGFGIEIVKSEAV
jgi:3,4-dihydroxy 2-butanone 4-phosphate synthase/GTP cyclohydrolase II